MCSLTIMRTVLAKTANEHRPPKCLSPILFSIVILLNLSAAFSPDGLAFLLEILSSLGFHLRGRPFSLIFTCPFSPSPLLNPKGPKAQDLDFFPFYTHSLSDLIQSHGFQQYLISSNSWICICRCLPWKPDLCIKLPRWFFVCFLWVFVLFCFVFRAAPSPYGSSRGPIRAAVASLHHSHSNARSQTHWLRSGIESASSWILVRFISTAPQQRLLKLPRCFKSILIFFFFFSSFLATSQHMEFLAQKSDLICSCNLHHSSSNTWSFNPLRQARDWTCVLVL